MKQYRNNGAIGAILDEYERALVEFKSLFSKITTIELRTIVDPSTNDPNSKSIETMVNHMISAGYAYVNFIKTHQGEEINLKVKEKSSDVASYLVAFDDMFEYNVQLFKDYPTIDLEESDIDKKILVSWGQRYDVEQLFEHAIVHILRHRRQLERYLIKLRT